MMKFYTVLLFTLFTIGVDMNTATAQCASAANVHSFTYNGNDYEIISEMKNWDDAAACAVERGGYLVHIDDMAEQQAMMNEVLNIVDTQYTTVSDGGNAAYVWIGANDILAEGNWVWDGDNTGTSDNFWVGDETGMPYMGAYNNWGGSSGSSLNEPDNFQNNQNAAAMGLQKWPVGFPQTFGVQGEWNDIEHSNQLYYIVEKSGTSVGGLENEFSINIYPNPVHEEMNITGLDGEEQITISDINGRIIENIVSSGGSYTVNTTSWARGVYLVRIADEDGKIMVQKLVKE